MNLLRMSLGLLISLCFLITLGLVSVLTEVAITCITDKHADILEKCSPQTTWLSLYWINVLTLLLYAVNAVSFGCLLMLCWLDRQVIGFVGLNGTLLRSWLAPKHLSTHLVVWGVTAIFVAQGVIEFGASLGMWDLTCMAILNLLLTNWMTMILTPLDLSYVENTLNPVGSMNNLGSSLMEREQPSDIDEEDDFVVLHDRNTPLKGRVYVYAKYIFLLGLATALLLNLFFFCYDAAVVTLRAAYNETGEEPRRKALLLLSSLASVWYRAFQARFFYHKLLFPACDVLATVFPGGQTMVHGM